MESDYSFSKHSRRDFLKAGAASVGGLAVLGHPLAAPSIAPRPPAGDLHVDNVILIISDTLRRDAVSCYGPHWIDTPHLRRFAEHAVIFEKATVSSFPTVPLRNDVLTGRYTFAYKPWAPIDVAEVTLQETLGKAGILTSLIVDTPHPFAPGYDYQRGFDAWQVVRGQEVDPYRSAPREVKFPCDPAKIRLPNENYIHHLRNTAHRTREEDYFVAQTMIRAADWLAENNDGRRFFLYVDTFDPHEPWDPPHYYVERYDPGYDGEEVMYPRYDLWREFLSERELHHCRALYAGEVTLVDRWIGFLLDRVASLDLLRNTAVIITADHGFYHGEHGYIGKSLLRGSIYQNLPLYPEVSRIPMLVYFPGCPGGTRLQALAQAVDMMPTVLDLLGVSAPPTIESHSLAPLLAGRAKKVRDIAISSPTIYNAHSKEPPTPDTRSSITDGEWLLVYGPRGAKSGGTAYTEAVDSRLREIKTVQGDIRPELYDLASDPGCEKNVIDAHRGKARDLQEAYLTFLKERQIPEAHLEYFREL